MQLRYILLSPVHSMIEMIVFILFPSSFQVPLNPPPFSVCFLSLFSLFLFYEASFLADEDVSLSLQHPTVPWKCLRSWHPSKEKWPSFRNPFPPSLGLNMEEANPFILSWTGFKLCWGRENGVKRQAIFLLILPCCSWGRPCFFSLIFYIEFFHVYSFFLFFLCSLSRERRSQGVLFYFFCRFDCTQTHSFISEWIPSSSSSRSTWFLFYSFASFLSWDDHLVIKKKRVLSNIFHLLLHLSFLRAHCTVFVGHDLHQSHSFKHSLLISSFLLRMMTGSIGCNSCCTNFRMQMMSVHEKMCCFTHFSSQSFLSFFAYFACKPCCRFILFFKKN